MIIQKILIFTLLFTSMNTIADVIDVYPNPHLTDPSLATTFASKLRNENLVEIDKLIKGECNQFKQYAYLSIKNWSDLNHQIKSLDEANTYSYQLTSQFPYQQSFQYTFPLGIEAYSTIENHIKISIKEKKNRSKLLNEIDDFCLRVNNSKYYSILSSPKYLVGSRSPFISQNELLSKFNPEKSIFKTLNFVPSQTDKLTSPNMNKTIKFTKKDLDIACLLIDNDIKNSFINSDVKWIDYKNSSRMIQNQFIEFMHKGGKNKQFSQLAVLVKTMSLIIPDYNNIYQENLSNSMNNINLNQLTTDKEFKILMAKFGY